MTSAEMETVSGYDEAVALLTEDPLEQRLDVHMSRSQYLQLEEFWSKIRAERDIREDKKYPLLGYNAAIETATVITGQRSLHEGSAATLAFMLLNNAEKYLSTHGPDDNFQANILNCGAATEIGTYGAYAGSTKSADHLFEYFSPDIMRSMMTIAVGYGHEYAALCQDKDLWILGMDIDTCILVCFDESPRFQMPTKSSAIVEDARAEVARMRRTIWVDREKEITSGHYCPVEYGGHKWFGEMKQVFIEVWRANRKRPDRYMFVQNSWSLSRLPISLGLKIHKNGLKSCKHTGWSSYF
ncbi:hypothetical protein V1525DRAFT_399396 [Lipomyces kononenkoae]|uniref:Uncharacterized protein n=1 Tax=Lipomyces kononenkoae TaxID=34357 RepID=A0ACC3T4U7_LIPKO